MNQIFRITRKPQMVSAEPDPCMHDLIALIRDCLVPLNEVELASFLLGQYDSSAAEAGLTQDHQSFGSLRMLGLSQMQRLFDCAMRRGLIQRRADMGILLTPKAVVLLSGQEAPASTPPHPFPDSTMEAFA